MSFTRLLTLIEPTFVTDGGKFDCGMSKIRRPRSFFPQCGDQGGHPSLAFSVLKTRPFFSVYNPEMTLLCLYRALVFLDFFLRENHSARIVIVNTHPEFTQLTETAARLSQQDCVKAHWVGGTLTNWPRVVRSIKTLHYFERHYKPFLTRLQRPFPRLRKLKKAFQGYRDLEAFSSSQRSNPQNQRPDLLILLNPEETQIAVREANYMQIPVIAIVNSESSCQKIAYPIPGNPKRLEFVYFCLNWLLKIQSFVTQASQQKK